MPEMTPEGLAEKTMRERFGRANFDLAAYEAITHAMVLAICEAVAAESAACAAIARQVGTAPKMRDGSPADWIQIEQAILARAAANPKGSAPCQP